jgi:phosphate-selective porin OprO/OprP
MLTTPEGRLRVGILVLCCLVAASGRGARAQDGSPPPPASISTAPAPPAPSVEQLAERLRKTEEMNRKLAEQLERNERRHNEQMRVLLERYGELSDRLNERERGGSPGAESPWATWPPPADGRAADLDTPLPDYRDGSETPGAPGAVSPRSGSIGTGRGPLKADFGPGFRLETEDEEYQLQVDVESQIRRYQK